MKPELLSLPQSHSHSHSHSRSRALEMEGRFYIQLKPGETTVVSWRKLVKEAARAEPRTHTLTQTQSQTGSAQPPAGAHPALEARIAPEVGAAAQHSDPPPPNRFSSVIEKIERLYKGVQSSDEDENLSDAPDDDRYDTSDSFIDDEELDEYFSVDKEKIKHSGFFVNRGKLEKLAEPIASPLPAPKKRKRNDIKKPGSEMSLDHLKKPGSEMSLDHLKKPSQSGARLKVCARKVPLSTVGPSDPLNTSSAPLLTDKSIKENTVAKNSKEPVFKPKTDKEREVTCDEAKPEAGVTLPSKVATANKLKETLQGDFDSKGRIDNITLDRQKDMQPDTCLLGSSHRGKIDVGAMQKPNFIACPEANSTDFTKDTVTMTPSKIKQAQKGSTDDEKMEGKKLHAGNTSQKTVSPNGKDISPIRLKGSVLERAIQDLEKGVVELCPSALAIRKFDQSSQSGGKRNRLPRDVRQKLAKVARLAAKQGRISDDVVQRLMGILGHVMQVKTLKKNLKDMVERGKSAMEEKEGRLQGMKRDVTEMVRSRVSSLPAQDLKQQQLEGSSDEIQTLQNSGDKGLASRFPWDEATEDCLCDLYDHYIEGMDEYRGPQIRKLYAELVGLWPEGWMDKIGVKDAVHRARERKKNRNKLIYKEELRKKQKAKKKQSEGLSPVLNSSEPFPDRTKISHDDNDKVAAMKKSLKLDGVSIPQTKPSLEFKKSANMLEENSIPTQTVSSSPTVIGNL